MSRGINIFQRQKLKRLVYFWSILDLFWKCLPPNFCKILLISPEPFITEYHKDEKNVFVRINTVNQYFMQFFVTLDVFHTKFTL